MLRKTYNATKKEYSMRRIEDVKTPSDMLKLMRTDSNRQENVISPLSHEGKLITYPGDRAVILQDALLARHQASEDLPPPTFDNENRIL